MKGRRDAHEVLSRVHRQKAQHDGNTKQKHTRARVMEDRVCVVPIIVLRHKTQMKRRFCCIAQNAGPKAWAFCRWIPRISTSARVNHNRSDRVIISAGFRALLPGPRPRARPSNMIISATGSIARGMDTLSAAVCGAVRCGAVPCYNSMGAMAERDAHRTRTSIARRHTRGRQTQRRWPSFQTRTGPRSRACRRWAVP